jgi:hypothetical protein
MMQLSQPVLEQYVYRFIVNRIGFARCEMIKYCARYSV